MRDQGFPHYWCIDFKHAMYMNSNNLWYDFNGVIYIEQKKKDSLPSVSIKSQS